MRKINKYRNMDLIVILILGLLCPDLAYSSQRPITTLRLRLGDFARTKEAMRIIELRSLGIANPEEHSFLVSSTLTQPFGVLKKRASSLDKVPGLRVSYKAGPGIDRVAPEILIPRAETIADNLLILNVHGIDHVTYFSLLVSDTEKLKKNILFLEGIGFDFTKYPISLGLSTRLLQTNHMILNDLGIEIIASLLQKNTDELMEEIIAKAAAGDIHPSKSLRDITSYLAEVRSGSRVPNLIVGIEEKEGQVSAITRKEAIEDLKKLGIKDPELYPSLIALGAPVVAQRIKILQQSNPAYQFNGIKNPLAWTQILTYSPFTVLERSVSLKTPDADYNFNGIKNPESCPQIYGYDIVTVKTRIKMLKTSDIEYSFNGIKDPEGYPLILTHDPALTKKKVKKIKDLLHIDNIEDYAILLQGDVDYLVEKAKGIDAIEGLRVSYKGGPGIEIVNPTILLANPKTIKDNLALFEHYHINHVTHFNLLKSSTIKLRMNIMVCEIISFDFIRYPNILMLSTETLVANYTILNHLGARIMLDYLGRSTEALIQRIKYGRVPLNTKLNPAKVKEYLDRALRGKIRILVNMRLGAIRESI